MGQNETNPYDVDACVAEIYDRLESDLEDVALVRRLIHPRRGLHILEPFCGTGRILLPLAKDGHRLVGLDQARGMLARARLRLRQEGPRVRGRVLLRRFDVTQETWPRGFDLIILANNCLYELATPEEQEAAIAAAAGALKPGGYVFVDNDHMEGELDPSWQEPGKALAFPTGVCAGGVWVESTLETVWFDAGRRLARFRRQTKVTLPGGETVEKTYLQQKHPVSCGEVRGWLQAHGFQIEAIYGDRDGSPYTEEAPRAIFWAHKLPEDVPAA